MKANDIILNNILDSNSKINLFNNKEIDINNNIPNNYNIIPTNKNIKKDSIPNSNKYSNSNINRNSYYYINDKKNIINTPQKLIKYNNYGYNNININKINTNNLNQKTKELIKEKRNNINDENILLTEISNYNINDDNINNYFSPIKKILSNSTGKNRHKSKSRYPNSFCRTTSRNYIKINNNNSNKKMNVQQDYKQNYITSNAQNDYNNIIKIITNIFNYLSKLNKFKTFLFNQNKTIYENTLSKIINLLHIFINFLITKDNNNYLFNKELKSKLATLIQQIQYTDEDSSNELLRPKTTSTNSYSNMELNNEYFENINYRKTIEKLKNDIKNLTLNNRNVIKKYKILNQKLILKEKEFNTLNNKYKDIINKNKNTNNNNNSNNISNDNIIDNNSNKNNKNNYILINKKIEDNDSDDVIVDNFILIKKNNEIKRLHNIIEENKSINNKLNEKIKKLDIEILSMKDNNKINLSLINQKSSQINDMNENINKLKNEINNLNKIINDKNDILSKINEEKIILENDLINTKKDIINKNDIIDTLNDKCKELLTEINKKQRLINEYNKNNDNYNIENNKHNDIYNNYNEKIKELEEKNKIINNENNNLIKESEQQKEKINKLESIINELKEKINNLNNENKNNNKDIQNIDNNNNNNYINITDNDPHKNINNIINENQNINKDKKPKHINNSLDSVEILENNLNHSRRPSTPSFKSPESEKEKLEENETINDLKKLNEVLLNKIKEYESTLNLNQSKDINDINNKIMEINDINNINNINFELNGEKPDIKYFQDKYIHYLQLYQEYKKKYEFSQVENDDLKERLKINIENNHNNNNLMTTFSSIKINNQYNPNEYFILCDKAYKGFKWYLMKKQSEYEQNDTYENLVWASSLDVVDIDKFNEYANDEEIENIEMFNIIKKLEEKENIISKLTYKVDKLEREIDRKNMNEIFENDLFIENDNNSNKKKSKPKNKIMKYFNTSENEDNIYNNNNKCVISFKKESSSNRESEKDKKNKNTKINQKADTECGVPLEKFNILLEKLNQSEAQFVKLQKENMELRKNKKYYLSQNNNIVNIIPNNDIEKEKNENDNNCIINFSSDINKLTLMGNNFINNINDDGLGLLNNKNINNNKNEENNNYKIKFINLEKKIEQLKQACKTILIKLKIPKKEKEEIKKIILIFEFSDEDMLDIFGDKKHKNNKK